MSEIIALWRTITYVIASISISSSSFMKLEGVFGYQAVFICVHPSTACPIHPFLPIAFAFSRGSTTSQKFLFSCVTFNRKELASPWKWKSSCCHPHSLRTLLSAESNGPHAVLEKSHRNISDMLLFWEPGYISLFILTTSSLCSVHPCLAGWHTSVASE